MLAAEKEVCTFDWAQREWQRPRSGLGGDFVISEWEPHRARFFIGDVTGHGDSAAEAAALVSAALRRDLSHGFTRAGLRRWNRLMRQLLDERFVAFTSVEINRYSGSTKIATAGNPSVILRRQASGLLERYQSNGMPLGLVDDNEWQAPLFHRVTLQPGDEIICFTDGLTDALGKRNHKRFGMDRALRTLAADRCHNGARALSDSVRSFVDRNVEQDDITVLSLSQALCCAA